MAVVFAEVVLVFEDSDFAKSAVLSARLLVMVAKGACYPSCLVAELYTSRLPATGLLPKSMNWTMVVAIVRASMMLTRDKIHGERSLLAARHAGRQVMASHKTHDSWKRR
jgi:hypothetical protein